jgi:hypothetical protein
LRQPRTRATAATGNPGGRPAGLAQVKELARQHTAAAIERLFKEMNDGEKSNSRIAAAYAILDPGRGKLTQPLAGDVDEHGSAVPNEDWLEKARRTIRAAFGKVIDEIPGVDPKT